MTEVITIVFEKAQQTDIKLIVDWLDERLQGYVDKHVFVGLEMKTINGNQIITGELMMQNHSEMDMEELRQRIHKTPTEFRIINLA